jgi:hypothetical protein
MQSELEAKRMQKQAGFRFGLGIGKAGITRYGLRLPLASIGLRPGDEFAFNILVLDSDDGKAGRFWLRPAAGIEYPWRTELYPRFMLAPEQPQNESPQK